MKYVLLFLTSFATFTAFAKDPRHIKVVFVGTISFQSKDTREEQTPTGNKSHVHSWKPLAQTTNIPAVKGTTFGVIFDPRQSLPALYKTVWHLPASGAAQRPADLASGLYESTLKCETGSCGTGYTLEDPWELIPGPWVLELWQQDRLVYKQTFNIGGK